jgi:hypothetical protein
VKHDVLRLLKIQHGDRTQVSRAPVPDSGMIQAQPTLVEGTDHFDRTLAGTVQIGRERVWPWVLLGAGVLAGIALVLWQLVDPAAPPAPPARPPAEVRLHPLEPGPPATPAEPAPATAEGSQKDAPSAPEREPTALGPGDDLPTVKSPRPARPRTTYPPCTPDASWKAARERDLQDLTKLAAQNGYLEDFERRERELTPAVQAATPQTCGPLGAQIEMLARRYHRPRETPAR